jgi:hypothetical protein
LKPLPDVTRTGNGVGVSPIFSGRNHLVVREVQGSKMVDFWIYRYSRHPFYFDQSFIAHDYLLLNSCSRNAIKMNANMARKNTVLVKDVATMRIPAPTIAKLK